MLRISAKHEITKQLEALTNTRILYDSSIIRPPLLRNRKVHFDKYVIDKRVSPVLRSIADYTFLGKGKISRSMSAVLQSLDLLLLKHENG